MRISHPGMRVWSLKDVSCKDPHKMAVKKSRLLLLRLYTQRGLDVIT